ncbi:MAG: hypothetical protein K8F25_01625, partial [Fimbriimonadaceae bacterium]|nr:hypothetical protein [Alphaproteobacteria bacterium]
MKPKATFTGTGMAASTQGGLIYRCPQCGVEAKISDSGALFMGLVYSLFWGSAGLWAFVSGPLWYARHASYFSTDDLTFLLFDMVVIVFCIGVMALSGWIVWSFLLGPAITILLHPVTGENRVKTDRETAQSKLDRRTALLSLFVYPLLLW